MQVESTRADRGDIKARIIDESIKLFLAKGFKGTSVKEITEKTEIGRGTLYWYFSSKDEILESIFKKWEETYVNQLIAEVSSVKGDFADKYRLFCKFASEFALYNRELVLASNALMYEVVGTGTEAEKLIKEIYEKYRSFIEQMLIDGIEGGSVKPQIDPAIYSYIVLASHEGTAVEWLLSGEEIDMHAFLRTFRDFILDGVGAKKNI